MQGLLTMTDARWSQTIDFLRSAGLATGPTTKKLIAVHRARRKGLALTEGQRAVGARAESPARGKTYPGGREAILAGDLRVRRREFLTLLAPAAARRPLST